MINYRLYFGIIVHFILLHIFIMKILSTKPGISMTVVPEDMDDMWVLYNNIHPGDLVEASTTRKVNRKNDSKDSFRKTIYVHLRVSKTALDTRIGDLQISGVIENEIDDVPNKSSHTLEATINRQIKICKQQWSDIEVRAFEKAALTDLKAEIGAIILQDGIAHVCIITSSMTILKSKIEVAIPKKTAYESSVKKIDKAHAKFFDQIYAAVVSTLPLGILKALLIASPAFYAAELKDYLFAEAELKGEKELLKFKDRTVVAHSSSGYLQSLKEVLSDPSISQHLSSAKHGYQFELLEKFYTIMNRDDGYAWYGPKHVRKAAELGAVDTLLMTDTLFRSHDVQERKEYIDLVEQVEASGGHVEIFSSQHDAGAQLDDITGIAALLKFPLPELEDVDSDDDV